MIVGLCQQFHCLPSQLAQEDTELLQLLNIANYGKEPEEVRYGE